MDALHILAAILILYGLLCLATALAKPAAIWRTGKLQGLVQLLGERSTVILLNAAGLIALVAGIMLLLG